MALTELEWLQISKQAEGLYTKLELDLLERVAESIKKVGVSNSIVEQNVKILQEMGVLYEDIITLVAKFSGTTYEDIERILMEADIKTLNFDDKIYKKSGLTVMPLIKSPYLRKMVEVTARRCNLNLSNLTNTTAVTAQSQFYNAVNEIYLQVTSGAKSQNQATRDVLKNFSKEGIKIRYPSGREMSIESAIRMNIVTSISRSTGEIQKARAEEMGWDIMELTAHVGARVTEHDDFTNHSWWQGHLVSLSSKKRFKLDGRTVFTLDDIGYPDEIQGFKGINCRHGWHPYLKGATPSYTNKELEAMNNKKVTYNGKQIGYYEATQKQRAMERQIRQDKKDMVVLRGFKEDYNHAKEMFVKHRSQYEDFCRQTGLRTDYSRLEI